MKRIFLLLSFMLLNVTLIGCSRENLKLSTVPAQTDKTPIASRETWLNEWDNSIRNAKKEGTLVIYGDQAPVSRDTITKAVQEKFGIRVEFLLGRGAEVREKLLRERRAGIFHADIYAGGATTATISLKPAGILVPLQEVIFHPEVKDDSLWRGGLFYDKDKRIAGGWGTVQPAIYINTAIVKSGEIKSFDDLLHPQWKERIVINDPTTTGTGQSTMSAILVIKGEEFIKKLVEQKPIITRDQRAQLDWLAKGKIPVTIGVDNSIAKGFKDTGAPISPLLPEEGAHITTATGCVGLIDSAPHPNAGRLFINWILTREAQTLWSQGADFASRRLDVSAGHLEPARQPQTGVRYIFADEEWQLLAERRMMLFKELFKPVM